METALCLRGGGGAVSIVAIRSVQGREPAVIDAARARWRDIDGLAGAALHSSAEGDFVELRAWRRDSSQVAIAAYGAEGSYSKSFANEGIAIPGPGLPAADYSLRIDATSRRPAVLSRMACTLADQQRLVRYLLNSAERFQTLIGGWLGAVIYPSLDGDSVVEYLQFESLEAMTNIQGLPALEEHKANILGFGALESKILMPVAAWSRDVDRV